MIDDSISNKFSKSCLKKMSYHIVYLFSLYRISVFLVVLLFLSHPIHMHLRRGYQAGEKKASLLL